MPYAAHLRGYAKKYCRLDRSDVRVHFQGRIGLVSRHLRNNRCFVDHTREPHSVAPGTFLDRSKDRHAIHRSISSKNGGGTIGRRIKKFVEILECFILDQIHQWIEMLKVVLVREKILYLL